MIERKIVSLRRLGDSRSETVKFERLLGNKNVSNNRLIQAEQERLRPLVKGRHVLGIQDTTEINFEKHAGRVHGLGTVGNGKDLGFFMHPMLAIDAESSACLGCAAIHIENRLKGAADNYKKLPIEEKESYRWISTAETSKKVLSEARCVTFIGDRENDIYEFLDRIPDEHTHIITRVRSDRLLEDNSKLYSYIEKQAEAGMMLITVPQEMRKGRKKREALLAIKYSEIDIKRPKNCSDKTAEKSVRLTLVEAKEMDCPEGEESIEWRLFTTHKVSVLEDAKQIVFWYRKRWNIEQIFRTMKKQGLDIESSQVESAEGLMKLSIIALCAAVKIMQLVLSRDGNTEQKTKDVFSLEEQFILTMLLTKVEGKTTKQKNPYPKENLAWASWIISRLGGWKGYISSERPPGPITIGRGLMRFQGICDGWSLFKNVCVQ